MTLQPKVVSLKLLSALMRVFHGIMIGIVILYLVPFIALMADDAESYPYVRAALTAEKAVSSVVRENVPTRYGGRDLTRILVIIAALLVGGIFSRKRSSMRWGATWHSSPWTSSTPPG
jgi:hypothetical protein